MVGGLFCLGCRGRGVVNCGVKKLLKLNVWVVVKKLFILVNGFMVWKIGGIGVVVNLLIRLFLEVIVLVFWVLFLFLVCFFFLVFLDFMILVVGWILLNVGFVWLNVLVLEFFEDVIVLVIVKFLLLMFFVLVIFILFLVSSVLLVDFVEGEVLFMLVYRLLFFVLVRDCMDWLGVIIFFILDKEGVVCIF